MYLVQLTTLVIHQHMDRMILLGSSRLAAIESQLGWLQYTQLIDQAPKLGPKDQLVSNIESQFGRLSKTLVQLTYVCRKHLFNSFPWTVLFAQDIQQYIHVTGSSNELNDSSQHV